MPYQDIISGLIFGTILGFVILFVREWRRK